MTIWNERSPVVAAMLNPALLASVVAVNGWEGEVQGLRTSLSAAAAKMVGLDRAARAPAANDPVNLGMPGQRPAP